MDVYSKNALEMATVAAEYCAFIEKGSHDAAAFLKATQKLHALIYLKGSLLETEFGTLDLWNELNDGSDEEFVAIEEAVNALLGSHNLPISIYENDNFGETPDYLLSEFYALMYCQMKAFLDSYRSGDEDMMQSAAQECTEGFRHSWGTLLLGSMPIIHNCIYNNLQD
jgi:hypothetical protein